MNRVTGKTVNSLTILLMCLQPACFTSQKVWNIGVTTYRGEVKKSNSNTDMHATIKKSNPTCMEGCILNPFSPWRYIGNESNTPEVLEPIRFNYRQIKWNQENFNGGNDEGKIILNINGENQVFQVMQFKRANTLRLESHTRKWYGYPAQTLLVASYPLDLIQALGAAGLHGIGMLYLGLTYNKNDAEKAENKAADN